MSDNQRSEKDQLRNEQNNTNENTAGTGRSYDYGTEGSDENVSNNKSGDNNKSSEEDSVAPRLNSNSDHSNASANRGGTTDMGSEALIGRGQTGGTETPTTKRNVTGSDYDGQVSR